MSQRYTTSQLDDFATAVRRDGHCVLRAHLPTSLIQTWHAAFTPLLAAHRAREGHLLNRGSGRFYVTLPFIQPFADARVYDDDDVLGVVERLVGSDGVLCQMATDTPVHGSTYQEIHRDTPPLFPETGQETPPYQLAVNFPLVDVTLDNGPFEVAVGTHMMPKAHALERLKAGELKLEPLTLRAGDVVVRDVRALHRGTPNRTDVPRPMVVVGYSRPWLFRPEVSIIVPRASLDGVSDRARQWLRFNPVVRSLEDQPQTERYQSFAY